MFVALGFEQVQRVNYNETFVAVVKFASIRILLSLVTRFDLEIHEMDVFTAFLNGYLREEIYREVPDAIDFHHREGSVCKRNIALYRFKQTLRQ